MRSIILCSVLLVSATVAATCSGHGTIVNGTCECYPDYQGPLCENRICSNGGTPDGNKCDCAMGFFGESCDLGPCYYHGDWKDGKCDCYRGYGGKYCNENTGDTRVSVATLVIVGVMFISFICSLIGGIATYIKNHH